MLRTRKLFVKELVREVGSFTLQVFSTPLQRLRSLKIATYSTFSMLIFLVAFFLRHLRHTMSKIPLLRLAFTPS